MGSDTDFGLGLGHRKFQNLGHGLGHEIFSDFGLGHGLGHGKFQNLGNGSDSDMSSDTRVRPTLMTGSNAIVDSLVSDNDLDDKLLF